MVKPIYRSPLWKQNDNNIRSRNGSECLSAVCDSGISWSYALTFLSFYKCTTPGTTHTRSVFDHKNNPLFIQAVTDTIIQMKMYINPCKQCRLEGRLLYLLHSIGLQYFSKYLLKSFQSFKGFLCNLLSFSYSG